MQRGRRGQRAPPIRLGSRLVTSLFFCNYATVITDDSHFNTTVREYVSDPVVGISTYGDIGRWDVRLVTDMSNAFAGATTFNADLSRWDTGRVTTMESMFSGAAAFNSNLDTWDVSSVTTMREMFSGAASFNSNLNTWAVSSVVDMSRCARSTRHASHPNHLPTPHAHWSQYVPERRQFPRRRERLFCLRRRRY